MPVKIILVDMPLDDDSYAPEERRRLHEDHEAYLSRIEERMRELGTAEEQ